MKSSTSSTIEAGSDVTRYFELPTATLATFFALHTAITRLTSKFGQTAQNDRYNTTRS